MAENGAVLDAAANVLRRVCEAQYDLSDRRVYLAWLRTHMANERTFLSWCRTGITLLAFGFVLERFDLFLRLVLPTINPQIRLAFSEPLRYVGIAGLFVGAAVVLMAGWRFVTVRRHINRGDEVFSTLPDILLFISVIALVAAALVIIGMVAVS